MKSSARERLCLALDRVDRETILTLAETLSADIACFKLNSAYVRYGPSLVRALKERHIDVFLDLKFHDIPVTVAAHVAAAAQLGVDWLTVHAGGGYAMMQAAAAAARAVRERGDRAPRILAVTVLTSLDRDALNRELRVEGPLEDHVAHLADAAVACQMDGLVCSAADLPTFRDRLPADFARVTPGIAGISTAAGSDQKRVADPRDAIRAGASMLVIGRAILEAPEPAAAAREIRQAIEDIDTPGA